MKAEQATKGATLADLIDRILDKGLVINADISVAVGGVQLIDIRIRAAIASLETAVLYGLELPSGTAAATEAFLAARVPRENCPGCAKRQPVTELLEAGCPWCGWQSARTRRLGNPLLALPQS